MVFHCPLCGWELKARPGDLISPLAVEVLQHVLDCPGRRPDQPAVTG